LAEFHAYALLAAGYVEEADSVAEHWYRQYADLPGMSRSMAIAAHGMTALGRGDLAAARRHLNEARTSFGGYGEVSGLFYRFRILHTEILARSGDADAAMLSLDATRNSRHPTYEYVESDFLIASAWVAAVAGRATEARDFSRRAAEFARSHGQLAREVRALQTAAQFGARSYQPQGRRHSSISASSAPVASVLYRYGRGSEDLNRAVDCRQSVERDPVLVVDVRIADEEVPHHYRRLDHLRERLGRVGEVQ
jgi:hypothetical protein